MKRQLNENQRMQSKKEMTGNIGGHFICQKSTISEYENDKIDLKFSVLKEIAKSSLILLLVICQENRMRILTM